MGLLRELLIFLFVYYLTGAITTTLVLKSIYVRAVEGDKEAKEHYQYLIAPKAIFIGMSYWPLIWKSFIQTFVEEFRKN